MEGASRVICTAQRLRQWLKYRHDWSTLNMKISRLLLRMGNILSCVIMLFIIFRHSWICHHTTCFGLPPSSEKYSSTPSIWQWRFADRVNWKYNNNIYICNFSEQLKGFEVLQIVNNHHLEIYNNKVVFFLNLGIFFFTKSEKPLSSSPYKNKI